MPSFADPFYGNVPPRKMTLEELIRALRLNLAAEEEATAQYMAHADATDNPLARKVLIDIANEERVHVGEFEELINILTQYEERVWIEAGAAEVREMAAEVAQGDLGPDTPAQKAVKEGISKDSADAGVCLPTIGSLKE
jgi:rubrerythrin